MKELIIESHQLLMEEFDNMDKLPMFEIETEKDEYEIYNLHAEIWGLWTFGNGGVLEIEWDSVFSLDEHLQEMFCKCQEDSGL